MTRKYEYDTVDKEGKLVTIDMLTGLTVHHEHVPAKYYTYTVSWGEAICSAIRRGMTMKQIAEDPRLPSIEAIYNWRRTHPDFKEKLLDAKRDRAEYYRDLAIEIADTTETKEESITNRLKIDTYRWAAEKDDPASFGTNVKVDTHHSGAVGFYALRTGVPREVENILPQEEESVTLETDNIIDKETT